jgi:hypothetical protein
MNKKEVHYWSMQFGDSEAETRISCHRAFIFKRNDLQSRL